MNFITYNPADFVLRDHDQREHLRAIWLNNSLCLVWRQLILDNNRRGERPNHNPTEADDIAADLAKIMEQLHRCEAASTWVA